MSDQHVVTDWKAYFASLPDRPYERPPFAPMYPGEPRPRVVYVRNAHFDLESVDAPEGENLFDFAQEIYEANGGPEMWIFSHTGGSPWRVEKRPTVKKRGR